MKLLLNIAMVLEKATSFAKQSFKKYSKVNCKRC